MNDRRLSIHLHCELPRAYSKIFDQVLDQAAIEAEEAAKAAAAAAAEQAAAEAKETARAAKCDPSWGDCDEEEDDDLMAEFLQEKEAEEREMRRQRKAGE